eukprot:jgi/Mesen1/10395/ME000081S09781
MACAVSGVGIVGSWFDCSSACSRLSSSSEATSSYRSSEEQSRSVRCTPHRKEASRLREKKLEVVAGIPKETDGLSFSTGCSPEDWWRNPPQQEQCAVFGQQVPGLFEWNESNARAGTIPSHPVNSKELAELPKMEIELATDMSDWLEHDVHLGAGLRGRDAGVPVFIMLPLDSITMSNTISRPKAFKASLLALKSAGVEGVMMDVWWGIVENERPGHYEWSAYRELVAMVKEAGLKIQVVMSFHQCGGNVGDHCLIPLPQWVVKEMDANPDIAYTDKAGRRNLEYISLGCDLLPVLCGRTPVQVYSDFMRNFRDTFKDALGDVITEIQVGMGPAGELRYPAYPESNEKWRFPGIGEFQCYDKYMLASLRAAAEGLGRPHWGFGGPHDAGYYNQWPNETGFFHTNGSWNGAYGQFFLQWYSGMLLRHGDRILSAAAAVFRGTGTHISGKVAGIHWHYGTHSHAAELTAGYYNTVYRDGYLPIARTFARHGATLNFTCIEMRDTEQPMYAMCSPEGLLRQVVNAAKLAGVRVSGENALPRFDEPAHEQIVRKSRLQLEGVSMDEPMSSFTFLRMSERLFRPENWRNFVLFVRHMREGRTFFPWEQEHHVSHMHLKSIGSLSQAAAELMLQ